LIWKDAALVGVGAFEDAEAAWLARGKVFFYLLLAEVEQGLELLLDRGIRV